MGDAAVNSTSSTASTSVTPVLWSSGLCRAFHAALVSYSKVGGCATGGVLSLGGIESASYFGLPTNKELQGF